MSEYTQGVCADGAAILKDGQPLTIEQILEALRERDALAAYAEDFCSAAYQASEVMDDFNKDQCEARNRLDHFRYNSHESVKKSLARRDALKQAEALEEIVGCGELLSNSDILDMARGLRQQAEGHQ